MEQAYLDLGKKILETGNVKGDRRDWNQKYFWSSNAI